MILEYIFPTAIFAILAVLIRIGNQIDKSLNQSAILSSRLAHSMESIIDLTDQINRSTSRAFPKTLHPEENLTEKINSIEAVLFSIQDFVRPMDRDASVGKAEVLCRQFDYSNIKQLRANPKVFSIGTEYRFLQPDLQEALRLGQQLQIDENDVISSFRDSPLRTLKHLRRTLRKYQEWATTEMKTKPVVPEFSFSERLETLMRGSYLGYGIETINEAIAFTPHTTLALLREKTAEISIDQIIKSFEEPN